MRSSGIVNPEQLAILTTVLDDICITAGVAPQSDARDDIAAMLLDLYQDGHRSSDQYRAAVNPTLIKAIVASPHDRNETSLQNTFCAAAALMGNTPRRGSCGS